MIHSTTYFRDGIAALLAPPAGRRKLQELPLRDDHKLVGDAAFEETTMLQPGEVLVS